MRLIKTSHLQSSDDYFKILRHGYSRDNDGDNSENNMLIFFSENDGVCFHQG